jgi:dolichyl-phosphate beta-glucosyltransferase
MWLVIPCYNEAERLDEEAVARLLDDARVNVLFVNDGSSDGTSALLQRLVRRHGERVRALELAVNGGKGEAVRRGMLEALKLGVPGDIVGFFDADFATPPEELPLLLDAIESKGGKVALGARIARLGAHVERSAVRHYIGRVFATAASTVLSLSVYDTQCGAKLFRDVPALRAALAVPFRSRWAFDVEFIGRLLAGDVNAPGLSEADFIEVPLRTWRDKRGSKLSSTAMLRAGMDVLTLGVKVAKRGRTGFFP